MYGGGVKEYDITGNLGDCLALKNIEKRREVKYMDKKPHEFAMILSD